MKCESCKRKLAIEKTDHKRSKFYWEKADGKISDCLQFLLSIQFEVPYGMQRRIERFVESVQRR